MRAAYRVDTFRLSLVFALAGVLLGSGLSNAASAQQPVPLRIEDALQLRSFANWVPTRFSPDGRKIAYTVQDPQRLRSADLQEMTTGAPSWAIGADIVVLDIASGESNNITEGIADNWLPGWSPDGRYLAFLSDRGDRDYARLWIWDAVSNEQRKVSDARIRVNPGTNNILWTPDSKEIVIAVAPERPDLKADMREKSLPSSREVNSSKQSESTVTLYSSDARSPRDNKGSAADPWDLDIYLRDLILIDVSNGSYRLLVQGRRIAQYRMSPNGARIAYTIPQHFERPGSQQTLFDLSALSLETGAPKILASDIRLPFDGSTFSWSPDSSSVAYQTGGPSSPSAQADCYVIGMKSSSPSNITNFDSFHDHTISVPLWDADGHHVYVLHEDAIWRASLDGGTASQLATVPRHRLIEVLAKQGYVLSTDSSRRIVVLTHDDELKQSGFYGVDIENGETVKLLEQNQSYVGYQDRLVALSPDGKLVVFFVEDAQHSQDLWLANPDFRNARRLTHINPQLDKYQFGAARLIAWRSLDGEQLHGALLLPAGYKQGKTYPLIVCVYGGESLSNNLAKFGLGCGGINMQLFATRGYAVLLPDAPQHLGTPMLDVAKTVLPGVDKVIDMGIADPERLGIMGHSYGAYSTLSLLVQTHRFKVALAADGASDLISAYGQMNANGAAFQTSIMEGGQGLMGGPPWEFPQRYIENSPFFYLDRVDTPLLIVHGAQDKTVAPFLGDELFVGLRRLGKMVLYAKYQGEDHSPANWSYANQLDFSNRIIAWFNQYLNEPSDPRPDAKSKTLSQK